MIIRRQTTQQLQKLRKFKGLLGYENQLENFKSVSLSHFEL